MEQPKDGKVAEEMVDIFHVGKGHGPLHIDGGVLNANTSMKVRADIAKKLCGAYHFVKLVSDIVPGGVVDPKLVKENALLKAEIARLEGLLKAKSEPATAPEAPADGKPAKGKK
jgi:hypothetical protein